MATEAYTPLQQPQLVRQPQQQMAPQLPAPPEIEGFLKKLKRKTSSSLLSGSWNKRWFFVDPRRRSIFLDDITAVVQFDDTHFQVESRTRNFFLCGESKASTSCWVSTLDEYRKKLAAYEKDKTAFLAACKLHESATEKKAIAASSKPAASPATASKDESSEPAARIGHSSRSKDSKKESKKKTSASSNGGSSRQSSASSSASRSSSSASSSDRSPDIRQRRTDKRDRRERAQRDTREARRSPPPTSTPESSPPRATSSRKDRPPRIPADRRPIDHRSRDRERGRHYDSRDRGGRGRETWRDEEEKEEEDEEDVVAGESVFETTSASRSTRGRGGRAKGAMGQQSASSYPSRGHVIQAWIDEDFD